MTNYFESLPTSDVCLFMDLRIPPDVELKARLLQIHDFIVGEKKSERNSHLLDQTVRLKMAVMWIEQFGILHMVWSVDNSYDLNISLLQTKYPEKRLSFADDINEAGRMAIAWVSELVLAFDANLALISPCPIKLLPAWTERAWPK